LNPGAFPHPLLSRAVDVAYFSSFPVVAVGAAMILGEIERTTGISEGSTMQQRNGREEEQDKREMPSMGRAATHLFFFLKL
jgi:hypothetical protein